MAHFAEVYLGGARTAIDERNRQLDDPSAGSVEPPQLFLKKRIAARFDRLRIECAEKR